MSGISTEQRLRLVHQIRQEQHHNRQALQTREQILYGRDCGTSKTQENSALQSTSGFETSTYTDNFDTVNADGSLESTLGLRMLIAAILLVGYFFFDNSNASLGGLDAEVIRTEVNRYSGAEINLFDFMDNITYTLNAE